MLLDYRVVRLSWAKLLDDSFYHERTRRYNKLRKNHVGVHCTASAPQILDYVYVTNRVFFFFFCSFFFLILFFFPWRIFIMITWKNACSHRLAWTMLQMLKFFCWRMRANLSAWNRARSWAAASVWAKRRRNARRIWDNCWMSPIPSHRRRCEILKWGMPFNQRKDAGTQTRIHLSQLSLTLLFVQLALARRHCCDAVEPPSPV